MSRNVFNFFDKKEQEVFSAFLKRRKATARRCFPARRRQDRKRRLCCGSFLQKLRGKTVAEILD